MNADTLGPEDFPTFFRELHGTEPFPWQRRLVQTVRDAGQWPAVLDLPTAAGKTATLDAAVFLLALDADHGPRRTTPIRIAFVVDRRLIVDDAYERARAIAASSIRARSAPAT